ncbi:MAG: 2OG-Fe(II) oxygenase [Rhizomicrobium sp.]
MPNQTLTDHVMVFSDTLAPAHCLSLIDRFESSPDREPCQRDQCYSFTQLDITKNWPDEHRILVPIFLTYFNKYQVATNARFWPPKFSFENLRLKRYQPGGQDSFETHVDVMGQMAARRFMTAIIYLNAPSGGETVFPNLDLSVAPEPGKFIAFPPLWLFPHAGLPPKATSKYILHTYLCYPT